MMTETNELKELEKINEFISLKKTITTPDILIDIGLEADIIDLLILLAKHKYNDDFEYLCVCISKISLKSFRDSNNYMLSYIDNEKKESIKKRGKHNIFDGIFDEWYI